MYVDLYGDTHLEPEDVAKMIVRKGLSQPFLKVVREPTKHKVLSMGVYTLDDERVTLNRRKGLYVIYRKYMDDFDCVYVGESKWSIDQRLRRFFKEAEGKSRHDESHPAAKKAREDGVYSTDMFFVKFVDYDIMNEVDRIDPNYKVAYKKVSIDKYVASILESKYNTRKAKVYGNRC